MTEERMIPLRVRRPSPSKTPLENFLIKIGYTPMITDDEAKELIRQAREGGQEGKRAKDEVVMAHLRFVVSIASQYQNQGVDLFDLILEGNFGLFKAIEKFDETCDLYFVSYAKEWIRRSIQDAIEAQKIIETLKTPTFDK